MNQLLSNANDFLSHGGFEYAICGGFALDLFTNTDMRIHSDIDVSVFEKDKNKIYLFMKKNKWNIYEFCGQGIVYLITSANDCQSNRNFMCVKDNCEIYKITHQNTKKSQRIKGHNLRILGGLDFKSSRKSVAF